MYIYYLQENSTRNCSFFFLDRQELLETVKNLYEKPFLNPKTGNFENLSVYFLNDSSEIIVKSVEKNRQLFHYFLRKATIYSKDSFSFDQQFDENGYPVR